jgi:hypothetical protein
MGIAYPRTECENLDKGKRESENKISINSSAVFCGL